MALEPTEATALELEVLERGVALEARALEPLDAEGVEVVPVALGSGASASASNRPVLAPHPVMTAATMIAAAKTGPVVVVTLAAPWSNRCAVPGRGPEPRDLAAAPK